MVATSHPLAALTAIEVLRSGAPQPTPRAAVRCSASSSRIHRDGGDCFALVQPRGDGQDRLL